MAADKTQVQALEQAIQSRARQLSEEHIAQGKMTRNKILQDAREKIKLMEQKALLSARLKAEREYQRTVQASELRMQAELDRNRWGLVQSVMNKLRNELTKLHKDHKQYLPVFKNLLAQSVTSIGHHELQAHINGEDLAFISDNWDEIVAEVCHSDITIKLSSTPCECTGGIKVISSSGDVMIDNTFEGIIARREQELHQVIFEQLFSTLSARGAVYNG